MPTRRRLPRGIRQWKGGLQAYIKVDGRTYSKSYPRTTALETLTDWREKTKRQHATPDPDAGSFEADVQTYLTRVSAMPTYTQRARHLEAWLRELGRDRARDSITAAEIDEVLQRWLTTPTNQPDDRTDTRPRRTRGRPSASTGLAPATVIKRRMALLSFFRTMNGKDGENPVRATKRPHPPKPEARGLDYTTVARILAAMPRSDTRRRLDVLAYTGLPPGLLATVTRFDLNLSKKTVRVRPRRKGAGVAAATMPLTSEGVRAFRAFHRADLYGPFSVTAANRSFKRACARLELRGLTVYDLRHSFLTQMFRITKDTSTTARFGLHASLSTTQRYVQAAMRVVDTEAAAAAGRVFAEGRKLSRKAVPIRQRRRVQ